MERVGHSDSFSLVFSYQSFTISFARHPRHFKHKRWGYEWDGWALNRAHPEMVGFGFQQGPSEFSTAGIMRAMSRIENERERGRGPKDAIYGRALNNMLSERFTINLF
jgi:hypothetical protein